MAGEQVELSGINILSISRITPQKHSEDRKMVDRKTIRRRIKLVLVPHSEMFVLLCDSI